MTIAKLDLGILQLTKVVFDESFILNHGQLLIIENLFCNSVRGECFPVSGEIDLRLLKHSSVVIEHAFCLLQLGLVWPRVDVDEGIALL